MGQFCTVVLVARLSLPLRPFFGLVRKLVLTHSVVLDRQLIDEVDDPPAFPNRYAGYEEQDAAIDGIVVTGVASGKPYAAQDKHYGGRNARKDGENRELEGVRIAFR